MSSQSQAPGASSSLSECLQAVAEALAAARTQDEVFGAVLTPALETLHAAAGAVLLVDETGERLKTAATQGDEERARTLRQDGPLGAQVPAGDALRRREPLFFGEQWDLVRAYPELGARTGGIAAVLPMFLDDRALGALILDFKEPHEFTPEEVRFLRTLAAQCALALGRAQLSQDLEARVVARTAELEEQRAALDAFVAYKEAVGGESDVLVLARQAVQVVRVNLEHVSAAYYELEAGRWKARVWSEDIPLEIVAQITAGVPRDAPNYAEAARTGAPLFVDGWDAAANGVPSGTSYGAAAFLPLVLHGEARSLFSVGTPKARAWTEREKALVRAVGRGLSVTLERTEHLRQLDEERAALAAFARFTEQSTQTTSALTLAELARDVLRATLGVQVGYSELEEGRWKGRVFSETTPPEVMEQAKRGFPADLPRFAQPFQSRDVVFVDGWDAGREEAYHTEVDGAAALYPYFQDGRPYGLLTMGTPDARAWTERERTVFRAVGHSLALAFERAEAARHLEAQNAELDARTRALEAFANLTRDLSLHHEPDALIERALRAVLPLLPPGYAAFYRAVGDAWHATTQMGEVGLPALQQAIKAGFPVGQTPSLDLPRQTGEALFQDEYDPGRDIPPELVRHLHTVATLPVVVNGEVSGIFNVALFGQRRWSAADRAVLETAVRQLGLALEGARAQRELSRAQHYLKVAAENAPILLFATDARGVFTLSEGRLLDLLGLRPGQAVGHSAPALFAHEPELRGGTRLNRALAGEEAHDLLHFASRGVTLETWFIPVKNAAGEVTEVVGVSLDVTGRLEAQRQIEQANEELRRSNAELEQFAYIASHDLQAPIRAVTSFAGVIDRRYSERLDDRGRLYLRQIVESGEHMKRLVDDLLAFSRVHTQRGDLRPVDAEAVFGRVAGRLQTEAQEAGAGVARGELPLVQADAQQLDQLLQNLISNGLKYRRAGVPPQVHVSAERDGEMWRFAVRDNGIGIEPQYFERIFVIFQRLHGRDTYEGTGIGLAVCKKIVERHGGQLWLESTPGEGSTFFFTLPEA